jgi:hypothetical protein
LGLARDVRRTVNKQALSWGDRADAILEPFKTAAKVTKVDLVRAFHSWRKLPSAGRLGALTILLDGRGLELEEMRLYSGAITQSRWGQGDEDTIDLRRIRLGLSLTSCVIDVQTVVYVGLHALSRRIERGSTSGLTPIFADLQALGEAYGWIVGGPNAFRVSVSSGGHWRGTVMTAPDGRPSLAVRTFLGANDA